MTDLSPAAQAVVTALEKFDWESGDFTREDIWALSKETAAAALRAAGMYCKRDRVQLFSIADELDPCPEV